MTDEYISRDAAFQTIQNYGVGVGDAKMRGLLNSIPAADVRPVVRGKWIDTCVRDWTCSVCKGKIDKVRHVDGYYYKDLPNFCPDCGARMEQ